MRRSIGRLLLPMLCAAGVSACSGGGGASPAMPAYRPVAAAATAPANANATPVAATTQAPSIRNAASPTPTPTSVVTATPAASAQYPIFSSYYTGHTPFHETVATLMSKGATVDSPTIAANYWSQGLNSNQPMPVTSGTGPLYMVHAGDPAYTFVCPEYGGCPAAGMVVHYPAGAAPGDGSDHHLVSFDPTYLNGEVDGWGGYGCTSTLLNVIPTGSCAHPCNLSSGTPGIANCSYGGFTSFSGSGLGSGGDAAGYAFGLFQITAQELLNGQINHALGIVQSCLDNNGVFPSGTVTSDSQCASLGVAEPNASYGEMIHLKSSVDVASLGYSPYCRTIVQALQTYGAYTVDNDGGYGISLVLENIYNPLYAQNNPWTNTIIPSILAGGDGTGTGSSFSFGSCLQRIPASDIEVIDIVNDGTYATAARKTTRS